MLQRVASLGNGLGIIHVGGETTEEVADNLYKVESAINSINAANQEGWILGGGAALVRAAQSLKEANPDSAGSLVIAAALQEPVIQLADNSHHEYAAVIREIAAADPGSGMGFDANRNEVCDLVVAGVLDAGSCPGAQDCFRIREDCPSDRSMVPQ